MTQKAPQVPAEFDEVKIVVFYGKDGNIIITKKLKDIDFENLPEGAVFYAIFKLNLIFEKIIPIK